MIVEKVQEVIDWHLIDEDGQEYAVEQMRDYGSLEFDYTVWDENSGPICKSDSRYWKILEAIENYE